MDDHSSEFCLLKHRPEDSGPIYGATNTAHLKSPRFDQLVAKNRQQTFGRAYFCVYNVSMSCPSNAVDIITSSQTTWPVVNNTNRENYVAFYSNSNKEKYAQGDLFYGQPGYNTTLYNDSFIAVMWTNHSNNKGVFGFTARCSNHPAPSPPTAATSPASETTTDPTSEPTSSSPEAISTTPEAVGSGLGGEEATVMPNSVRNN